MFLTYKLVFLAVNKEAQRTKHYWQISFPFQVHAEEISGNNGYVELSFCAKKLDDKVSGAHSFNTQTRFIFHQIWFSNTKQG